MNSIMNKPAHTVLELFCGCGGMSTGFEMAGLYRDCDVIAGAQTRRSVVCPGGFSDFSNIIQMIPTVSSVGEQKGDRT